MVQLNYLANLLSNLHKTTQWKWISVMTSYRYVTAHSPIVAYLERCNTITNSAWVVYRLNRERTRIHKRKKEKEKYNDLSCYILIGWRVMWFQKKASAVWRWTRYEKNGDSWQSANGLNIFKLPKFLQQTTGLSSASLWFYIYFLLLTSSNSSVILFLFFLRRFNPIPHCIQHSSAWHVSFHWSWGVENDVIRFLRTNGIGTTLQLATIQL